MTARVELVDLRGALESPESIDPVGSDSGESVSTSVGLWAPVLQLAEAVCAAEGLEGRIVVALVDEATIADLNRQFRGVEGATDVLSFRYEEEESEWPAAAAEEDENIGEVVLCLSVIERYAEEEEVEPARRLAWSLVHGVLHLAGYDHEQDQGEMEQREAELLSRFEDLAAAVVIPPVP